MRIFDFALGSELGEVALGDFALAGESLLFCFCPSTSCGSNLAVNPRKRLPSIGKTNSRKESRLKLTSTTDTGTTSRQLGLMA